MSKKLTTSRVLAIAGLKGGLGKTTLAMLLACWYAINQGLKVLVVDADPSSQTAFEWHRDAKAAGMPLPFDMQVWPHKHVGEMIKDVLNDYDVVIVDIGGEGAEILKSTMEVADDILVATTPKVADLKRLDATLKAAVQGAHIHGRQDLIAPSIVLTQVDSRRNGRRNRTGDVIEGHNDAVRQQITGQGWPLMDACVSLRTSAYPDVVGRNPYHNDVLLDMSEIEGVAKEIDLFEVAA